MTRLLIGYDGSAAAAAAITAAGALFTDADASVVTVYPPPPAPPSRLEAIVPVGIEHLAEEAEHAAAATAAEGVERARAAGLRVDAKRLSGSSAWRVLRSEAQRTHADLIVCGTRGGGSLGRAALGSTASSVLHHADRPLLVVPAGTASFVGPLLVGYDESAGARAALRFAAEHLPGRRLIVGHAWRSPVRHTLRGHAMLVTGAAFLEDYVETIDEIWEAAATEIAQDGVAHARGLGLSAEAAAPESGRGDWHALLRGARTANAAAILVGSRGRGPAASTVLGSIASALVHAAELPVLVVPHWPLEAA